MASRFSPALRTGGASSPFLFSTCLAGSFGNGGLVHLEFSQGFVHSGAEIGVLLLLFMLGLEYTGELKQNLRAEFPAGLVDFALNFPPGMLEPDCSSGGPPCPHSGSAA